MDSYTPALYLISSTKAYLSKRYLMLQFISSYVPKMVYQKINGNLLDACVLSDWTGEVILELFIIEEDTVKKAEGTDSIAVDLANGWNNMIWWNCTQHLML